MKKDSLLFVILMVNNKHVDLSRWFRKEGVINILNKNLREKVAIGLDVITACDSKNVLPINFFKL
jgi:hypothetical protein